MSFMEEKGSTSEIYRQCELRQRQESGGEKVEIVWIPAEFAHKGKTLKILIDGQWQEGWKVSQSFSASTRRDLLAQEDNQRIVEKVLDPHR